MADHKEITLAVAQEASYGSYFATWNVPDPAGKAAALAVAGAPAALTFQGWQVIRAQWFQGPTMKMAVRDFTRMTSAPAIPSPRGHANAIAGDPTIYGADPGELMEFYTGSIEVEAPVPALGSGAAAATHLAHPFWQVLASTCGYIVPGAASDVVAEAALDSITFKPTAADHYRVGEIICIVRNNAAEYAVVSKVDRATPKVFLTAALTGGALEINQVIIHCVTFHEQLGTSQTSVCLRMDMEGKRQYAVGARLESFSFEEDADGLLFKGSIRNACIVRDDAEAETIATLVTDGFDVERDQACAVLSTAVVREGSVPGGLPAAEFCPQDVSFSVEAKLSPSICRKRPGGYEQLKVGSTAMTATIVRDPDTTLERMHWAKNDYYLAVGYGPAVAAGGHGMAVVMRAAHRTNPEMAISENEDEAQDLTVELEAGEYSLDLAPDTGGGDPASTATNKPWLIGFPMVVV